MQGQVVVLVGPKGCGKTTIGTMLHAPPAVVFVDVERVAQRVLAELGGTIDDRYARRAFEEIGRAVNAVDAETVVIETTAASPRTSELLDAIGTQRDVRYVRVTASEQACRERMAARDPGRQVSVPDGMIRDMYLRSTSVELPWSLEILNEPVLPPDEIARRFAPLLARGYTTS